MGSQVGGIGDAVVGGGGALSAVAGAGRAFGGRRGVRAWSAGAIALIACTGGLLAAGAVPALAGRNMAAGRDAAAVKGQVAAAYGRLPLAFEPNRGQAAAGVRYLAHGPGYGVFITADRTVVTLAARSGASVGGRARTGRTGRVTHVPQAARHTAAVLSFRPVGGNADPVVAAGERLAGRVNYLRGRDRANWRTNIPTYREVTERGVYPGVDLRWYGTRQGLEYDVTVAPGADAGKARFAIDGLSGRPRLTEGGNLLMPTAAGDVVQRAPRAYQIIGGSPRPVAAGFTVAGADQVGFTVAGYDHRRPLIIDPGIVYSTYLGGTGYEEGNGIAVDSAGNAYVTGDTESTNFPVRGAAQPRSAGGFDAFVTKLDPTGTAPVYSTYLGGTGDDLAASIAVDSSGSAYLTGLTDSGDFPTTAGAFQTAYGGGPEDAFVTKLDPTGGALAYSTYLGGDDYDQGNAIAVDASGDAYLTGFTYSANFPYTTKRAPAGAPDAFVTKLNSTGGALVYSTFLGGSGYDEGGGIEVDSAGNAYLTGVTASTDFPTTAGAFQRALAGALDAFVTKLDPTGTAPVYSTYLGGTGSDLGYGIAVDASGDAYVTGGTDSTDFPHTSGAFQPMYGGGDLDAFVTKVGPTGGSLVYSTYLGGASSEDGDGIAVDASGDAYVTGGTDSRNFPHTSGAFQPMYGGGRRDAYLTKVDPSGGSLVYSTYLGGRRYDDADGIAVDSAGNAYLTGATDSRDFPHTSGAFQPAYRGGTADAFVTRFGFAAIPRPTPQPARPARQEKHHPAPANDAVTNHADDTAVTGDVNSHAHDLNVNSSRSRTRLHTRHKHSYRWHHR